VAFNVWAPDQEISEYIETLHDWILYSETGFLKLKLSKSPLKNRLDETSLDVAMRVSIEGDDFDDVKFEEAFAYGTQIIINILRNN